MEYKAVKVMTSSTVEHRADGGYIVKTGDKETFVKADIARPWRSATIWSGGSTTRSATRSPEAYLFGDARRVQNIMYAIWDAYEWRARSERRRGRREAAARMRPRSPEARA